MKEFFEKGLLDPLELMARQVLAVLPSVLAMSIIFSAGLVVAWTASQALERLLRVVGLDRLFDRLGVTGALLRGGVKTDPSRLVGQAAYWLVMIFATVAALGALNLQPINDFAKSFLAYVPHLVTAGLILVAGWLLSNFVSQAVLIGAVNAGLPPLGSWPPAPVGESNCWPLRWRSNNSASPRTSWWSDSGSHWEESCWPERLPSGWAPRTWPRSILNADFPCAPEMGRRMICAICNGPSAAARRQRTKHEQEHL